MKLNLEDIKKVYQNHVEHTWNQGSSEESAGNRPLTAGQTPGDKRDAAFYIGQIIIHKEYKFRRRSDKRCASSAKREEV